MILDFTTTAMARPEIVEKTYQSFTSKLAGVDYRRSTLFINIDPLPSEGNRDAVVKVARKYFGKVVANQPRKPNFTAAINWLWSNATADYIFHLEDDWILTETVQIGKLMKYFGREPELMTVALRAYKYHYDKIVLSPSLMKRDFYSRVGGKLDESINPEIQLRGRNFGLVMPETGQRTKKVIAYPKRVICRDIGRKWIKGTGYTKPPKAHFTSWDRKNG